MRDLKPVQIISRDAFRAFSARCLFCVGGVVRIPHNPLTGVAEPERAMCLGCAQRYRVPQAQDTQWLGQQTKDKQCLNTIHRLRQAARPRKS